MPVVQRHVELAPVPRGVHLITREIVAAMPELRQFRVGLAHVFMQHTSASLALNENASADVRRDLDRWLDDAVPDGWDGFAHVDEGDDDMPAHVRSVLTQTSIGIPIADRRLALGTWQGLYLWEHRTSPHERTVTVSVIGE